MPGTGLPIPDSGKEQLRDPGVIGAGAISVASSWREIAQSARESAAYSQQEAASYEKIATVSASVGKEALHLYTQEKHRQQLGVLSEGDVKDERARIEIRDKRANDPEGFKNDWGAYSDGVLSETPDWALDHRKKSLGHQGNTGYATVLTESRNRDNAMAKDRWTALVDSSENEVAGAALAGTLDSTEGKAKLEKYRSVLDSGVAVRFIAPEERDRRFGITSSEATVYSSRAAVKEAYDQGGAQQAKTYIENSVIRNEKLQLPEQRRFGLASRLTADVHAWESERKASLSDAEAEASALLGTRRAGVALPRERIEASAERLRRFGGAAQAANFLTDMQHADDMAYLATLPPPEAARALDDFKISRGLAVPPPAIKAAIDDAATRTGVSANYLTRLAAKESSFDPNATPPINPETGRPASTAVGLVQFTDATWAATLSRYGSKYGLASTTPRTDPTANLLMAGELTKQNSAALDAAGVPVNDRALYLAHFAGAAGAVALLKASPDARAADVLPDAAASNRSVFYDRTGTARTVSQTINALTASFGGATATASDLEFVGKANKDLHGRVNTAIDNVVTEMDKGALPTAERVNALYKAAIAINDPVLMRKFADAASIYQFRREFGRAPAADELAAVGRMRNRATTTGLASEEDAAKLFAGEAAVRETREGLANDPQTLIRSRLSETIPAPAPLDMQNGPALVAGLRERAAIARRGAEQYRQGPFPAFAKAELAEFKSAYDTAPVSGKVALLGALVTGLKDTPDVLNATLGQIAGGGDTVLGIAGYVASNGGAAGSAAARQIIAGNAALAADKRFSAPDGGLSGFDEALARKLPPADFGAQANDAGAWGGMKDAIKAAYASLSISANDLSYKLDESRLDAAVRVVTGGTVKWRSTVNLPPEYGTTQKEFEKRVGGLTDADLAGAQTSAGAPITADLVKRRGDFKSLGNGEYLVQFNAGTAYVSNAVKADGTPFVLNLRRR